MSITLTPIHVPGWLYRVGFLSAAKCKLHAILAASASRLQLLASRFSGSRSNLRKEGRTSAGIVNKLSLMALLVWWAGVGQELRITRDDSIVITFPKSLTYNPETQTSTNLIDWIAATPERSDTNTAGEITQQFSYATKDALRLYRVKSVGQSAPRILVPPKHVTAFPGNTVTFTVIASGNPPPAFAWYGPSSGGTPLSTNLSLMLPSVSKADSGNYNVVTSNAGGSVTSVAILTVLDGNYSPATFSNKNLLLTPAGGQPALTISTSDSETYAMTGSLLSSAGNFTFTKLNADDAQLVLFDSQAAYSFTLSYYTPNSGAYILEGTALGRGIFTIQ